jgi:hypothetical protein
MIFGDTTMTEIVRMPVDELKDLVSDVLYGIELEVCFLPGDIIRAVADEIAYRALRQPQPVERPPMSLSHWGLH